MSLNYINIYKGASVPDINTNACQHIHHHHIHHSLDEHAIFVNLHPQVCEFIVVAARPGILREALAEVVVLTCGAAMRATTDSGNA